MCLTYGRPQLLEEAIHAFLQQDYEGPKELIVLNDFPRQNLSFKHPEVKIINVAKRFRGIGEKRNACAALATHDWLFVWDDDDIFLPDRIRFSMEKMNVTRGYFKPDKAFMLDNGVLSGPVVSFFHSGACYSRKLFDKVHGYLHMGAGEDVQFEKAVQQVLTNKDYNVTDPAEIFYLYRWAGTGSYHLSGYGKDQPGEVLGHRKVADYVNRQIEVGKIPTGNIPLNPVWRADYVQMKADYLKKLAA